MSNIGIMDGAFFVGRKEILDWLNRTLHLNLTKIEETAFGGVAIQLVDIMYPGQVPIHKVNWSAKQSFEFVGNYKILQSTMAKLKIDRYVDVDKLIKGKYQDNLEFMQWMKRFFEMSVSEVSPDYDPVAQRARGKGGAAYNSKYSIAGGATATSSAPKPAARTTASRKPASRGTAQKENTTNPNPSAASSRPSSSAGVKKVRENGAPSEEDKKEVAALKVATETQARQITDLKQEMDGLEKERDFYFDKLRDIEMMLQDKEDNGEGTELTASIFKILYATTEGFEQTPESDADAAIQAKVESVADEPAPEAEVVAAVE